MRYGLIACGVLGVLGLVIAAMPGCCVGGLCLPAWSGSSTPAAPDDTSGEEVQLEPVWSLPGVWGAVDVDAAMGEVFALKGVSNYGGSWWTADVYIMDALGAVKKIVRIDGGQAAPGNILRLIRLADGERVMVVGDSVWGGGDLVSAYGLDSMRKWVHRLEWTMGDVEVADLDGDGEDEVVLATGGGGVVAVGADGVRRWVAPQRKWVWGFGVVPASGGRRSQVVAAVNRSVVVVDALGKEADRVRTSCEYSELAVSLAGSSPVVIGITSSPLTLEAVGLDGRRRWRAVDRDVRRSYPIDMAAIADRPWVAVSVKDGRVLVYDTRDGRRLGWVRAGAFPELAWLPSAESDGPLLVVASSSGLEAFRVRQSAAVPAGPLGARE